MVLCASNYFVTYTFRIVKISFSTSVVIFINLWIYLLCLEDKDEGSLGRQPFASVVHRYIQHF